MNASQVISAIIAIEELLQKGPAAIAAIKAALSSDDEAALKAQLESLRQSNVAQYDLAQAALARVAGS